MPVGSFFLLAGLSDLPSQGTGSPPCQPRAALRTKGRGAGYHRAAFRAGKVVGFIQVKERFAGQLCAAVAAIALRYIRCAAAHTADLGLLHHIGAEAKAFHSLQTERLYSVSHRTHSLHKAALPHT